MWAPHESLFQGDKGGMFGRRFLGVYPQHWESHACEFAPKYGRPLGFTYGEDSLYKRLVN